MKNVFRVLGLAALAGLAQAQVVNPPNTLPQGESRLPTERDPTLPPGRLPDDCRRQSDQVRQQFAVQEKEIRREMADRERLGSTDDDRRRLRAELQQRLASLKLQAAEAQRRVLETCRAQGGSS